MAHIPTRFWLPSCRSLERKLVLNCVGCNRFDVRPQYLLMGDLPKERFRCLNKSFRKYRNGIDFADHFLCRKTARIVVKAQKATFVCFSSIAVHIGAVSDMQHDPQP